MFSVKNNIKLYFKRHKQSWGNFIRFHFLQKILKRLLKGSDPEPLITAPQLESFHLSVHQPGAPGRAGRVEHELSAAAPADPLLLPRRRSPCSSSASSALAQIYFSAFRFSTPILKRNVNGCTAVPILHAHLNCKHPHRLCSQPNSPLLPQSFVNKSLFSVGLFNTLVRTQSVWSQHD